MANYCNFKLLIVLKESPLTNNHITVKVSSISKGEGTDEKNQISLEVFAGDEKHGVEYLVLKFPTEFVQTNDPFLQTLCLEQDFLIVFILDRGL